MAQIARGSCHFKRLVKLVGFKLLVHKGQIIKLENILSSVGMQLMWIFFSLGELCDLYVMFFFVLCVLCLCL